jgi:[acyl-carrier-protein] S-malonyltransferase
MTSVARKTAFVFAGQGIDPPWIAGDLVTRARARPLIDAASDATSVDIRTLLLRGGGALARTEISQPALATACLIAAAALEDLGVQPDVACGHSLGELAAWAAGGYVSACDAIAVTAVRGRLMAREAKRHPGGMAVVHGERAEVVSPARTRPGEATPGEAASVRSIGATRIEAAPHVVRALAAGRAHGSLVVAAENALDEHVVSGDPAAIAAVLAACPSRRLAVTGAWHSPAMAGAVDELGEALARIPQRAGIPFAGNRDGCIAAAADIPALLAEQLVHPIRWVDCLRTLAALGVGRYVVIGPGKLMRALIRRTLGDVDVCVVQSEADLARVSS